MISLLWLALIPLSDAAEVVWLEPADPPTVALVARTAGAANPPLRPIELRAAATAPGPGDAAAWKDLEETLQRVRAFEQRLDGELVIMEDLQAPIRAIGHLPDETARNKLFAALAYQGFAVDRFFMGTLATDERAEPFRVEMNGLVVERPWADAVAMAPDREVTAYEVAEAPQRAAFGQVREQVTAALPGRIVLRNVPEGGTVHVDGRAVELDAAGAVRLLPGRHLAHVTLDGEVVARFDTRLAMGDTAELSVPLDDATWAGFLESFGGDAPVTVPDAVGPSVEALGGEVWIARPDPEARGGARVWKVTPDGAVPVPLTPVQERSSGEEPAPLGLTASVTGGWLTSGDFYAQAADEAPHEAATVNAPTLALGVLAEARIGPALLGGGADLLVPFGAWHVAIYGENQTRLRPHLFAAAGVEFGALARIRLTGGYTLPHHWTLGARLGVSVTDALEVQAAGLWGLDPERPRSDGTLWEGFPLYGVSGGLGWRL